MFNKLVLSDLLAQDPGSGGMPPLSFFEGGAAKLPIVIQLDATGFGAQQLNTIAAKNPYLSQSAQHLRVFGLGNCSDDRDGSTRLLGPNLETINTAIASGLMTLPVGTREDAPRAVVDWGVYGCFDVSALRHLEHISGSGWCTCGREHALRFVPAKPRRDELRDFLSTCHQPSRDERFIGAHRPLPAKSFAARARTASSAKATPRRLGRRWRRRRRRRRGC